MFEVRNGLTWADWCYTSRNKLALRHLDNSNRAMAEKELINGGKGDGCSLVVPGLNALTSNDIDSEDSRVVRIIDFAIEELLKTRWPNLNTAKLHNKGTLNVFRSKLEPSTTLFQKKEYITAIFNLFLADWVRSCQELNQGKDFYFLVIVHPDADKPFDFYTGYALGKCGSGTQWKVHQMMTQVFTFEVRNKYENNFSSLAGRIQSLRNGNSNREFPNPVEEPRNNTSYIVGASVILVLGILYWRSRASSSKE